MRILIDKDTLHLKLFILFKFLLFKNVRKLQHSEPEARLLVYYNNRRILYVY